MTTVYWAMLLAGGGVFLISFLLSGLFEGLNDALGGVGGGDGDGGNSPLSIQSIFGFLAFFGGTGILALNFGLPEGLSVVAALAGGLVGAVLIWQFSIFVAGQSRSSHLTTADYVGQVARVTARIAPGQVGAVELTVRGQSVAGSASSSDSQEIPTGAIVEVVERTGGQFIVRPRAS